GASPFDQPVPQYFDARSAPVLAIVTEVSPNASSSTSTPSRHPLDCTMTPCHDSSARDDARSLHRPLVSEGSARSPGRTHVLLCEFLWIAQRETTVTRPHARRHLPETSCPQIHLHHRPPWPVGSNDQGETVMVHIAFTCPSKICKQTVEAREMKAHSLRRVANLRGLWRRTCMVLAEWNSRALQRERLAQLNDHLLADVGL